MFWGVEPSWTKRRIINAKWEKVRYGNGYWSQWRRCIVPSSGFYEWARVAEKISWRKKSLGRGRKGATGKCMWDVSKPGSQGGMKHKDLMDRNKAICSNVPELVTIWRKIVQPTVIAGYAHYVLNWYARQGSVDSSIVHVTLYDTKTALHLVNRWLWKNMHDEPSSFQRPLSHSVIDELLIHASAQKANYNLSGFPCVNFGH